MDLVGKLVPKLLPHEKERVLRNGIAQARGVLRLAGDASEAQRHRVGPAGVAVVGDEPGGAIGHDGVDLRARGKPVREGGVGPAPSGHPVGVGVGGRRDQP